MNHVRIAAYDVLTGTSADIVTALRAPDGMIEIFRQQPGFLSYTVLEVDPITMMSLSVWETHDEAELAVRAAAEWTATHLGSQVHRTANYVGDALFWEGLGA